MKGARLRPGDVGFDEQAAATVEASMVLMWRTISAVGEVRLSRADIEAYAARAGNVGVKMDYDPETGDVVLTHRSPGQA